MSSPESLIAEAEKKAKPQSGFVAFFSGGNHERNEQAYDLYIQAANMYRLKKNFHEAGNTFEKAASLQEKLNNTSDASNALIDAYKSYKGTSPQDAIRVLEKAIHIFLSSNGQFRRAANFQLDLGELYESVDEFEHAAEAYEKAGDYYSTDQASALANKAFLKSADVNAQIGNYKVAVEHYANVIKNSITSNLTRWSLKDYFFKSIICYLAMGDSVTAKIKCDEYLATEPSFGQTREYKLAQDIITAVDEGDPQAFSDKVFEYDQFSKLDKLKTTLLLKIKEAIIAVDDDLL